jgi:hypothetical protein
VGAPAEDGAPEGGAVARSWVEHLRAGGTTPWPRWVRDAGVEPARPTKVAAAGVPGAAQLELLRRLNTIGPLPHRVDHVLGRPGPGRGPVHLRLPLEPLGPPAPRKEVLRVAAGVLADLAAQLPPAAPERRRRRARRPRPVDGVPSFVLEGPPVTVAELRVRLAAAGVPEHEPRSSWLGARRDPGPSIAVVLVAPLDEALRQAWANRVQHGAGRAWARFVGQWAGRGSLPPSAAVDRTVDHWVGRLGADHVHLVPVDPATESPDRLAARVTEVLGVGVRVGTGVEGADGVGPTDPERLAPAVVDVLRRVNVVLPFVSQPADRAPRRTALVALLRDLEGDPEPPDLPKRERAWVARTANRLVDTLADSGCPRHGDLDAARAIGPRTNRRLGGPEVLESMVRMIHRVDAALVAGGRDGRGGR